MHYNLYYLLREDQKRHPISGAADQRILRAISDYYRHRPPPENAQAPPGKKK